MPDAVGALIAFVLGGLFNAVVSIATSGYRATRDHDRALRRDREDRSRQAATALLEEFDRLADMYSWRHPGEADQAEMEPSYRLIRRRVVELADPAVRKALEDLADGFYYYADEEMFLGGVSTTTFARRLHDAARSILGSIQRGEPIPDEPFLADLRRIAAEVDGWNEEMYELELANQRAERARRRTVATPNTNVQVENDSKQTMNPAS